jgi:alpha-1,2-mannosyltransferase
VGVGLAAALKLTPLLFIGYLLVLRRWRAAATAAAVFGLAGLIGAVCAPHDSLAYWWRGTFAAAGRISDVAATTNHSWLGALARTAGEDSLVARVGYPVGAVVLVLATLAVAAREHRRGRPLLATTLCGLCSAAAAPFAWSHHWVWFVPLALVLGHRATTGNRVAATLLGVVLAGTVAMITALPGPGVGPVPRTGLISLWPDTYLLLFVIVLVAVAVMQRGPAGDRRGLAGIVGR